MAKELVTTHQTMAERFLTLKEKIAQNTTENAATVRADLDSRMLAHIHYRASELIDLVLG
jgi:hypothetical protein